MAAVLFVGESGAARAPLAEAIARHLRPDLDVWSAAARPSHVRPLVRSVLDEVGIPSGGLRARSVFEVDLDEIALVIAVCPAYRQPRLPSRFTVVAAAVADPTSEPAGLQLEAFRACRDTLVDRLPRLLATHLSG
jgi:arsenate reductase